jgi:hypothetical protein
MMQAWLNKKSNSSEENKSLSLPVSMQDAVLVSISEHKRTLFLIKLHVHWIL